MEPWRTKLAEGDSEAAWALFIDRYRRLILTTVRRTVDDDERVMDAFQDVCGHLSANRLDRLQRYDHGATPRARFSTWLVTVVHNLSLDWLRRCDGRRRVKPPSQLSEVQERIFGHVFIEQRSHAETYELIRSATPEELTFGAFLKELAETYRVVERTRARGAMRYFPAALEPTVATDAKGEHAVARAQMRSRLRKALASLPAEERLGVQLYVVDGLPAAEVAQTLGWPNAKAVYNRVYRALTRLRAALELQGVGPADL